MLEGNMAGHALWAYNGTYPHRQGNDIDILIDGQEAYKNISDAFYSAKKFIYLTISYCDDDFLLVPGSGETMFDILGSRQKSGVDVRMVVWQPADTKTPHTIPDKTKISGVNEGPGSIQARWDLAKGYCGWYKSPQGLFEPLLVDFPAELGCHHQKTYIMDDGEEGFVAFVGGINPVQLYWDTSKHDVLDVGRVEKKEDEDLLKGLEENPPLHDIFYRLTGPAVADVLSNFVERFNGASIPYKDLTSDVVAPVTADQILQEPNGTEVQVLRTIAPKTYPGTPDGEQSIREAYFNMLSAAEKGNLVYIENQYFFDHGIVSEIHDAAERGAKVIVILTSKPDEGTFPGQVENILEKISGYEESFPLLSGHNNVGLFTLGNSRSDPRDPDKIINSETYIHSKNMAVIGNCWAIMTGGSANIAFTSMWFHSEMNIVFTDIARIKDWVAKLWEEHLQISIEDVLGLIENPDKALAAFKEQAAWNTAALTNGQVPKGRVYEKEGTVFPPRNLEGIDLSTVSIAKQVIAES